MAAYKSNAPVPPLSAFIPVSTRILSLTSASALRSSICPLPSIALPSSTHDLLTQSLPFYTFSAAHPITFDQQHLAQAVILAHTAVIEHKVRLQKYV